jgi:hypothetical protein
MSTHWQPIESAPKDGTRIDLWLHIYASPRSFGMSDSFRVTEAYWKNNAWFHDHNGREKELYRDYITHWMPLPEPAEGRMTMPDIKTTEGRADLRKACVPDSPLWAALDEIERLEKGRDAALKEAARNVMDAEKAREMILRLFSDAREVRKLADERGAALARIYTQIDGTPESWLSEHDAEKEAEIERLTKERDEARELAGIRNEAAIDLTSQNGELIAKNARLRTALEAIVTLNADHGRYGWTEFIYTLAQIAKEALEGK